MEITFTTELEKLKEFLGNGLDNFNKPYNNNIVPFEDKKPFGFQVFDGDALVGGACGTTGMGNWAWVELLYVDEKYRDKDIGTKLIEKVEAFAREHKCTGVHLKTWDWQAKGFYEKVGFTCYGILENNPPGGSCHYMKKELTK